MAADNSQMAQRPNFFSEQFGSLKDPLEKKEGNDNPDPEEHSLYVLSLNDGWSVLDEYIKSLENELDESIIKLMESGASFEEIGQRTAVKEVVKLYMGKIRSKVRDAREAIEHESDRRRSESEL